MEILEKLTEKLNLGEQSFSIKENENNKVETENGELKAVMKNIGISDMFRFFSRADVSNIKKINIELDDAKIKKSLGSDVLKISLKENMELYPASKLFEKFLRIEDKSFVLESENFLFKSVNGNISKISFKGKHFEYELDENIQKTVIENTVITSNSRNEKVTAENLLMASRELKKLSLESWSPDRTETAIRSGLRNLLLEKTKMAENEMTWETLEIISSVMPAWYYKKIENFEKLKEIAKAKDEVENGIRIEFKKAKVDIKDMEIKITVIPIYNSAKGMWSMFSEYDELDNNFTFENPQARIKSSEDEIIVAYKRKQKISNADEKFAKIAEKKIRKESCSKFMLLIKIKALSGLFISTFLFQFASDCFRNCNKLLA